MAEIVSQKQLMTRPSVSMSPCTIPGSHVSPSTWSTIPGEWCGFPLWPMFGRGAMPGRTQSLFSLFLQATETTTISILFLRFWSRSDLRSQPRDEPHVVEDVPPAPSLCRREVPRWTGSHRRAWPFKAPQRFDVVLRAHPRSPPPWFRGSFSLFYGCGWMYLAATGAEYRNRDRQGSP